MPSMLHNADDWCYAGEGKLKVAFFNSNARTAHYDKVLLFRKQVQHGSSLAREFETEVMRKLLPDTYSAAPVEHTVLPDQIMEKLTALALKSRPAGRQRSGQLQLQPDGEVQPNYTRVYRLLPKHTHYHCTSQELSVELKVKCGLKATSPFIPAHRRVKLCMSRYQLIQYTKDKQAAFAIDGCLPWGKYIGHSGYMPEDLCSRDIERVRRGLDALIRNPQNNLRINVNGMHFFGWDKVDLLPLSGQLAQKCWNHWLGGFDTPLDGLVQVTAAILCKETVLHNLEQLQGLDVLDVEGAALVHKRMVELCQGSSEEALRYLEQHLTSCPADWSALLQDDCHCEGTSIVHRLRRLRINEYVSLEEWQARREQAVAIVQLASRQECAQLLQLFMVSLVARDASVVVAMRCASGSGTTPFSGSNSNTCLVVLPQSESLCGIVSLPDCERNLETGRGECSSGGSHGEVSGIGLNANACFAYTVGVVDLGLKDLDKLWRKNLEEDAICEAAARVIIE